MSSRSLVEGDIRLKKQLENERQRNLVLQMKQLVRK